MTDEIIIQQEKIGHLRKEWNDLLGMTTISSIFMTWEWMSGWCRNLTRPNEQPLVVTARQHGRLSAIAPLMRTVKENEECEFGFIGQDYSYGLGLIVGPNRKEHVCAALIKYLLDLFDHGNCSAIFRHLDHDPQFLAACHEQACQQGFVITRGYQNPGCAIEITGSFEEYLKHGIRSKKLRSTVPAQLRRLESDAKVEFYLTPQGGFEPFFRELLFFHRETMKLRSKDSILTGEHFPGHLASVVDGWPDPAALRLCNLNLNGIPAIRILGIVYRSIFFALTMGINPKVKELFPKYNLAVLSQIYCVKQAIGEGCTHYDMLGGSLEYKASMGGKEHSGMVLEIRRHAVTQSLPDRSVALVTRSFLQTAVPDKLVLGGVEIWTLSMAKLLISMGFKPVIFQGAPKGFIRFFNEIEVAGFCGKDHHEINRKIHEEIRKRAITDIIYASSFVGDRYFIPGNIYVQHGIHWDYPTGEMGFTDRIKWEWIRRKLAKHDLTMARASTLTIAVDTHFINYYRTEVHDPEWATRIRYIPNFCIPQDKHLWRKKWQDTRVIHLAFTRRFELRRGVVLMAEALKILLQSVPQLKVTLAGSGLYEPWLKQKFRGESRVIIKEAAHEEIYALLNTVHIAVIPSTYSEGTSLACLEAMACGCAVVSTTTGGLGNLVIPGYNGMFAQPEAGDIAKIIAQLIDIPENTKRMAMNGYRMVQEAFALSIWEKRIKQVLSDAGIR